jgi:pentatricopeptide repeat protein
MTHQNSIFTLSSLFNTNNNNDTSSKCTANNHLHHFTQYRFKRNDGNKAFFKQSKVDKKGLKHDRRRKARQYQEKFGKHSAPGSKAGPQRQWIQEETQRIIASRQTKRQDFMEELPEYGLKDALLDDLIGNTSHLSSTPSPQPIYLGDYHEPLVQQTTKALKKYEAYVAKLEAATTDDQKAAVAPVPPPNDRQISLVLRAYRDKNGTKAKPIGLHKALKHIVEELRLPTTLFGHESYTTLLTCCRTPKEAAHVIKLMQQRDVPICVYSWSILIDIHARLGDFQGCDEVMAEMKAAGVPPGLPAYTSLLAACYKVCNAGHISSSVRSKAGALGWEKWKEMRVNGVEADAMAYGAILRLLAARGRAEQAINILDEMKHFQVKPTTMCFTAALKAVARSHEISIRFENGASKRFRRREKLTLYHGRMTRDIVVKAEQAEVVQDDGFVAALMLCAAAAGDSATAKAILLASEVRRMDHLRTIGPETHLAALRGVVDPQDIINGLAQVSGGIKTLVLPEDVQRQLLATGAVDSGTGALTLTGAAATGISPTVSSLLDPRKSRTAFEEREFGGKDSRILTALMKACSSAIDPKGMGDMWAGKSNKGYLHENSLRLVATVQKPRYADNSIPGISGTEVGLSGMNLQDEGVEEMSKRLRRAKYEGGKEDMDVGFDMDTIDPVFYKMYEKDYNARLDTLHEETVRRLHMVQGRDWTGMPEPNLQLEQAQLEQSEKVEEPDLVKDINRMYYDASSGKFKQRKGNEVEGGFSWDEETAEWKAKEPSARKDQIGIFEKQLIKEEKQMETSMEAKEEWYFDQEDMKWKSKMVYPGESEKQHINEEKEIETSMEAKEEWYFDQEDLKWKSKMVYPGKVASAPKPVVKAPNHKNSILTEDVDKPEVQEEYYFDQNDLKWKTRTKTAEAELTNFEKEALAKKGVGVTSPRIESKQRVSSNHSPLNNAYPRLTCTLPAEHTLCGA